jgi:hypothetical protein
MSLFDAFNSIKSISKAVTDPSSVADSRKTALNTTENGWVVDTVQAFDTDKWETGVLRSEDGAWIITEQYDTTEDAQVGHDKYVEMMRKNPQCDLPNIQDEGTFDW